MSACSKAIIMRWESERLAVSSGRFSLNMCLARASSSRPFCSAAAPHAVPAPSSLTRSISGALASACARHGLWLRALLEAGYQLGWRVSELLSMRVEQVDLAERILRPDTSKNGEPREAVMPGDLYELIRACVTGKAPGDYVFTRPNGKPIGDFRGAWATVTAAAGVPDLLFHDLRRSAVRNMDRRGISQHVAMKISGHKTPSVYKRYRIVDGRDLREAAIRMEQPLPGQSWGRVAQKTAPTDAPVTTASLAVN